MKDNPEEDRKITDQELEYLRTSIGMEYICYIIYILNSLKICSTYMLNTYCKSFDNNNFADTIELNQSLIIYVISSTRKNRKLWDSELPT